MAKNSRTKLGADPERNSGFPKEYSPTSFKKNSFSNSFSPSRNQNPVLSMSKSTNMVTLLAFTDFTPITLFNHENYTVWTSRFNKMCQEFCGTYIKQNNKRRLESFQVVETNTKRGFQANFLELLFCGNQTRIIRSLFQNEKQTFDYWAISVYVICYMSFKSTDRSVTQDMSRPT